ncbi:uncharacterized protein LOC131237630 [Magnolia sinica]|uniref:uncharacterized protein LOC131237630 n=1 Tax=Magnolia sinica TaxID=86752 RepID=UPI002657E860|nr:uncharacterized protein LOC131237630 [Magnolia sinica]
MVFSVASKTETLPIQTMPSTSKPHPPLHNFSLPFLKWGNQRLLRCMKSNPNRPIPAVSPDRRSPPSDAESVDHTSPNRSSSFHKPSTPSAHEKLRDLPTDDGIEKIRAKLMDHLRTAADRIRYKVPEDGEEESTSAAAAAAAASASALRPWNLRTRRAACKAPVEIGSRSGGSLRLRSLATAGAVQDVEKKKEKERRKFSISLSRDEIEEDFFVITGSKPARRPKKRAKIVQRQLDGVFPGFWLSEITADTYRVPDLHEPGQIQT